MKGTWLNKIVSHSFRNDAEVITAQEPNKMYKSKSIHILDTFNFSECLPWWLSW